MLLARSARNESASSVTLVVSIHVFSQLAQTSFLPLSSPWDPRGVTACGCFGWLKVLGRGRCSDEGEGEGQEGGGHKIKLEREKTQLRRGGGESGGGRQSFTLRMRRGRRSCRRRKSICPSEF